MVDTTSHMTPERILHRLEWQVIRRLEGAEMFATLADVIDAPAGHLLPSP